MICGRMNDAGMERTVCAYGSYENNIMMFVLGSNSFQLRHSTIEADDDDLSTSYQHKVSNLSRSRIAGSLEASMVARKNSRCDPTATLAATQNGQSEVCDSIMALWSFHVATKRSTPSWISGARTDPPETIRWSSIKRAQRKMQVLTCAMRELLAGKSGTGKLACVPSNDESAVDNRCIIFPMLDSILLALSSSSR